MNLIAFALLCILIGWLLRGALAGRWRWNPKEHRLADARHLWVEIGGTWHAFTDDALRVALHRAEDLAPRFPHRWRARAAWALAGAGLLAVFLLGACSDRDIPTTKPQPVLTYWVSAGGESMLPTFPARALLEVESVPYDALRAGDTVIFWDYTQHTGATFIHHRLVEKQGTAWIARGDNPATNPRADPPWVTRDNYIGRTTGRHSQLLTAR